MAQNRRLPFEPLRKSGDHLMPGKIIDFDTIRKMALSLSGAEESTVYGSPAFKVCGKMFACIPVHKSAEPDSLAVCVDFDHREALLAEAPQVYYVTEHYLNYPIVLVRLSRVHAGALRDLLGGACRFISAQAARRGRTVRRKTVSRTRT